MSLLLVAFVVMGSFGFLAFISMGILRAIASIASCLMILKVFNWLKLFEQTSFFILLLEQTLKDINIFIILIFLALLMFGVPMVILNQNRVKEDSSIMYNPFDLWVFDMLINQYLLALGDWNLDGFANGPQTSLCFIFFAMATFIT